MIFRRFLNIALTCGALAAGTALGNDEAVLGAYDAFREGDPDRLERHARALEDHALQPWVDYWRLKLRIEDAAPAAIERYLGRHAGTYLGDQMRADWVRELGRREQWRDFERELGPLVQDDLEIRCYAWRARLARGDPQAAIESRAVWNELRDLPEGCQPLVRELLARGALDEERIWLRARLQLYYGYVTAARRTLEELPPAARPDERLLTQAVTAPAQLLARAPRDLAPRPVREMLVFATLRLARSDLDAGARALREGGGARLPPAEREYLWARLATLAAFDHRDQALDWYALAGAATLDDSQLAWKTRAALPAGRWRTVLDSIALMSPQQRLDLAWTYWRGRALAALGDAEGARAQYRSIAGQPVYYSVLATEELGGAASIPQPYHEPTEADVDEARTNVELIQALELYRLGLRTEATREWMFAVRNMGDRRLLAAAELARRAAIYDRAIGTAGRTELVHDFRMRYLSPFREVFREYAAAYGLEEAWVLGTVRQESRFIAEARSGAGATGLMQLLPTTARWVARRIGYKGYSAKRVAEVETNITLGARYLQHMLERTGHPVLASTAYNAGLSRALRWQPARALEGAIFVEGIPFDETREYVKRVMANTVHYALLLEGRSLSLKQRLGTIAGRDGTGAADTAAAEPADSADAAPARDADED
ncbi:MAG: transglycosylase SLT domain-containing protein [Burkholderiales bacterium]